MQPPRTRQEGERFLTVSQFARMWQISERTVYYWLKRSDFPGKVIRYRGSTRIVIAHLADDLLERMSKMVVYVKELERRVDELVRTMQNGKDGKR